MEQELKLEQEGTEGQRQKKKETESIKEAERAACCYLLVVATLSLLIGSLETTPSVL